MRTIASAKVTRFPPKQFASSAPTDAPTAVATIRSIESVSVAPSVDCITTRVAIAAQYASGICTSRATMTDTVAATAVRIACAIEGRFFSSQAQSFIRASSLQRTCFGKIDKSTKQHSHIFLPFEIDVSMSRLFAPRKHKNAAFRLPPIAEGEAEFRRRRISPVNFGQRLLMVFPELFAVRNEAPIELEGPTFAKGAQRNA